MTVSIVVAVRDGARFLAEAVGSALADGVDEVIVVDDGSRDGSAEVARRAGAHHVIEGPPRSPAAARNTGARAATGDLLGFLDADDRLPGGRTALLRAAIETQGADGAVGAQRLFGAGIAPGDATALPGRMTGTVLLRSAAFARVGGFDEAARFADHMDWFHRADLAGLRFVTVDAVVLERRRHDGNLSASDEVARNAELLHVARRAIRRRRAAGGRP